MSGNVQEQKMLRPIDIAIVVIFLFIALVSIDLFRRDLSRTFRLQNEEPVGTVVVKRNIVQRRLGDRVLWDRLAKESPVYYWDLIRVADLSDAVLIINDNSISLHENTLIRIIPSSDGPMILLTSGALSLAAGEESTGLTINVNGQQIRTEPGTYLNTSVSESGELNYQIIESADQIARETRSSQLISPAVNSVIRYNNNLPSLNFQWTEAEDAALYIIEISALPDFSNTRVQRQTTSVFYVDSSLEDGLWYWRVKPVMPSVFSGQSEFSAPSFFRIERTEVTANEISISQWLAMETPTTQVPHEVPAQFVPENFTIMEAPAVMVSAASQTTDAAQTAQTAQTANTAQSVSPAARTTVQPDAAAQPPSRPVTPAQPAAQARPVIASPPEAPPELLPAAQNLRPLNRTVFGYTELRSQRVITFSWTSVQGANAYIFTLYNQMSDGMHEVVTATVTNTGYTLSNLQLLDKGIFFWKVEPVRTARGNAIERRGNTAESYFTIDFPAPRPVQIEESGILYGN